MKEKYTIRMRVVNTVGVIARITGLISQRGYNIENILASPSEDPNIYTVRIVLVESEEKIEQISKQLNKLIDVIKVTEILHLKNPIIREFLIAKINCNKNRTELLQLIALFKAKVLDLRAGHMIVSISGSPLRISRFLEAMQAFGIMELDRSGEFVVKDE